MSVKKGTVVLLGLGMQGKAALYDLVNNSDAAEILVADNNPQMDDILKAYPAERVMAVSLDAADESSLASLIRKADVVIESLPPQFALTVGRIAATEGVHLVSSMYYLNPGEKDAGKIAQIKEELRNLDRVAKEKGAVILTEFGMDPGIDLVVGAKALSEFDNVEEFYSYGAGFPTPEAANNPLKYKFTWSVGGVIRSYLRPGKVIADGRVVEVKADEVFAEKNRHLLEIDAIGSPLECYPNGNAEHYAKLFGIRDTVKQMGRYACRLPGHCVFWSTMAKCGFLNDQPVDVNGVMVSPVQFTAALLGSQAQFYFTDQEQDMALIFIDVRGKKDGQKKRVTYQLIDRRDLETGFTSMQRTVGFTMSLGARLLLEGKLNKPGLLLPMDVPYELVADGLKGLGMVISRQESAWEKS
jgi:saccharopine dehydrogenase-like NADP-dependent oxidoreductase